VRASLSPAPSQARRWTGRIARGFSLLVGLVCVLYLGVFALGWYATYVRDTPTCVRYEVPEGSEPPGVGAEAVAAALAGSGLALVKSRKYFDQWADAGSEVTLYGSRAASNIFVCTRLKRSRAYQDLARRVESELLRRQLAVTASLQRDASVFACNPACSVTGVGVPVDFASLNATVLAFPAGH